MGEIEYLPDPGFPVQFFPFVGQADYQTPIVALQFKNLTGSYYFLLVPYYYERILQAYYKHITSILHHDRIFILK
jgi:hypothetical protein